MSTPLALLGQEPLTGISGNEQPDIQPGRHAPPTAAQVWAEALDGNRDRKTNAKETTRSER